jgi:hypothetical protein
MLMKSNSVLYVSNQLGHANVHTTLKYYTKYVPSMETVKPVALGTGRKEVLHDEKFRQIIGTSGDTDV